MNFRHAECFRCERCHRTGGITTQYLVKYQEPYLEHILNIPKSNPKLHEPPNIAVENGLLLF